MRTAELCTSQIGVILDDAGKPCAGGLLWFLDEAASTPRNIWSRDGEALRNPLPLGSDGCLTVQPYLEQGNYSLRLYKPTNPGAVYDPDDFPNGDWALVRTWIAAGAVPQTQLNGLSVEGVDGLKNLSVEDFAPGTAVIVDGYYQRGDCEARVFVLRDWSATPDDATIVEALGGGAYWEWTPGGTLDARAFGAVPDGIRDVSGSLSALAAYAAAHSCAVVLPAGTYLVGGAGSVSFADLTIQRGVSFVNGGAATLFEIRATGRLDCQLTEPLRSLSSTGSVKLSISVDAGDVYTFWNYHWNGSANVLDWCGRSRAISGRTWGGGFGTENDLSTAGGVYLKELAIYSSSDLILSGDGVNASSISGIVNLGGTGRFNVAGVVFADGSRLNTSAVKSISPASSIASGGYLTVVADKSTAADWGATSAIGTTGTACPLDTNYIYFELCGGILGFVDGSNIAGVVRTGEGGGIGSGYITCGTAGSLKASLWTTPISADAVRSICENSVDGWADLEGRLCLVSSNNANPFKVKNGNVLFDYSPALAYVGGIGLKNCAVSGGFSIGTACEVSGCTFDAPIVLAGSAFPNCEIVGNSYTGAGSALDVSSVTSWSGHVRVAGNFPAEHIRTPADAYWPQTEGAILSVTTSGSSNNITATPSNYPVVLFIGSTDCALVATTQLGKAVKAYPVDGSSFKVETADGTNFASGDRVSCFYNYSR